TGNLKYMNDILKLHTYNVESPPSYIYRHYTQIVVDKTGKLKLVGYRENKKTQVYFDKAINNYSYLKALSLGENKDLEIGKYAVIANCLSGKDCIIYPETALVTAYKENAIQFLFDDKDARDKFREAFSRLLDDARSKTEFRQ
ncbi:MAG TPA: hypothetical protein VGO21_00080, partial [Candidatus Paceibacterota bacterium]|nr:hypothetical protein [Candidatus Paceibacterota bacterium]